MINATLIRNRIALTSEKYDEGLYKFAKSCEGAFWKAEQKTWMIPLKYFPEVSRLWPWGSNGFQMEVKLADYIQREKEMESKWNLWKLAARSYDQLNDTEIPGYRLALPLYPYQRVGVRLLHALPFGLNLAAYGTGKSCMTLALLDWLWQEGEIEQAIIVTLAGVKHQWAERQVKRFAPFMDHILIQSGWTAKKRRETYRNDTFLWLLNYEQLVPDMELLIDLVNRRKTCMVLDEADVVRNRPKWEKQEEDGKRKFKLDKGIIAWAADQIGHQPGVVRRYGLTATPVAERYEDVWHTWFWVDQGRTFGKSYWEFMDRYATFEQERFGGQTVRVFQGYQRVDELREKMLSISFRRNLEETELNLPPVTYENVYVQMTTPQADAYRVANRQGWGLRTQQHIFARCTYLLQLATNPRLVGLDFDGGKQLQIPQMAKDLYQEPRKVVWWTIFTKDLKWLQQALAQYNLVLYYGEMSEKAKAKALDQFRNDSACGGLIGNPAAGGVGLDLVEADVMVWVSRSWKGRHYRQAIHRLRRIGQTKTVRVIHLLSEKTIELRIDEILKRKIGLANDLIVDEAEHDMQELLRDE